MFWIGMLVGIVTTILVSYAWIVYCFKTAGVNREDFCGLIEVNKAVIENRECTVEVWHDENCVHADTFEKR